MLRLWAIFVLLVVTSFSLATGPASAGMTSLTVDELCSFKLLPGAAVLLRTKLTITNAPGGRAATVRVVPGWNVARLYPKAKTAVSVRVGPGRTFRRTVTRRISAAPRLWRELRASGRIRCASTFTYRIP